MSSTSVPPFRDFPPGRMADRKQHLLAEIGREQSPRTDLSRLRRRGVPTQRPRRRRLVVLLAVAAILGTLAVAPAFGVGDALLHLFGRSEVPFAGAPPAASVIKREFSDMSSGAPKGMDPRVTSGQARLAGTFDFGATKRRVWVAPTETGGFCYFIEGISGGCSETRTEAVVLDGSFFARPGATTPALDALAGRIYLPQATQLRVSFEDGRTTVLPFRLRLSANRRRILRLSTVPGRGASRSSPRRRRRRRLIGSRDRTRDDRLGARGAKAGATPGHRRKEVNLSASADHASRAPLSRGGHRDC